MEVKSNIKIIHHEKITQNNSVCMIWLKKQFRDTMAEFNYFYSYSHPSHYVTDEVLHFSSNVKNVVS